MQETLPRPSSPSTIRLSYKFQRLREQLRTAVLSGEFTGRMPGERELGKRFQANAKTINKALCDLAGEGLVSRHIGRGTFVMNYDGAVAPGFEAKSFKMLLKDTAATGGRIAEQICDALTQKGHRLELSAMGSTSAERQTLLSSWPVSARRETHGIFCMIDDPFAPETRGLDDASIVEIIRRHLPMVMIGGQSMVAKLPSVVPDYSDAGYRLCEHLLQLGCRRILVATSRESGLEVEAVISGAAAACTRHDRPMQRAFLGSTEGVTVMLQVVSQGTACNCDPKVGPTGVICVGTGAMNAVMHHAAVRETASRRHAHMACVTAAGQETAFGDDVVTYEVSMDRMADWAVRIMLESRPGERAVEAIVPGFVRTTAQLRERS